MLGGLLIGLIETMWSGYVSIEYKDVAAFSVLIIVLIFSLQAFLESQILKRFNGKQDIIKSIKDSLFTGVIALALGPIVDFGLFLKERVYLLHLNGE